MTVIQKALADVESAWEEIKTTPIQISAEEWQKQVLRKSKKLGTPYSQEKGKYLWWAKQMLEDPSISQEHKNLILAEAQPTEQKQAQRKFYQGIAKLIALAEWTYNDLTAFLNDQNKDIFLRVFLRWRVFLPAEAYHKFYKLDLKGEQAKIIYQNLRPTVIFRKQ